MLLFPRWREPRATCLVLGTEKNTLLLWRSASTGGHVNCCLEEMKVSFEARVVPPPPVHRGRGVGNVGSEFPVKGKGKGKEKVKGESSGVKPTSLFEGEATLKPSARASAEPSSTKDVVSRVKKKKRKAVDASADPTGASAPGTVSFMKELWRTEGGKDVWGGAVLCGRLRS